MTADLATFLRARLDDTAQLAQAYIDRRDREGTDRETWAYKLLLADINAKRRIVDLCVAEWANGTDGAVTATSVLYLLALPWRDHVDYREEWTVD